MAEHHIRLDDLDWNDDELTTQPLPDPAEDMRDLMYSEDGDAQAEALAIAELNANVERINANLIPHKPSAAFRQRARIRLWQEAARKFYRDNRRLCESLQRVTERCRDLEGALSEAKDLRHLLRAGQAERDKLRERMRELEGVR